MRKHTMAEAGGDEDPGLEDEFMTKIKDNDLEAVKKLLAAGFNPNAKSDGMVPLHAAAARGFADMVTVLATNGAILTVNIPGDVGDTPLYIAVERGHLDVVRALIAANAGVVNVRNSDGRTPVWCAIWRGRYKILKAMLEAGALVDEPVNGVTPLHIGATHGGRAINVKNCFYLLLAHGANGRNRHPRTGATVLHEAVEGAVKYADELESGAAYLEMCQALLSGVLPTSSGPHHYWQGQRILLSNPNVPNAARMTPLFTAAASGSDQLVRLLLEHKADPNIVCGDQGETALWVATLKRRASTVALLKAHGAHPVNIETSFNDRTL
jgi:ankyrin repeat protein